MSNTSVIASAAKQSSFFVTWIASSLLLLAMTIFPLPALAAPLIGDLSNYRIDITSDFNGTRIFLFGARNDAGDVVVVVRGPARNYIVRKKEEIAGIWINSDRRRFWDIPDFYAVAASKPLTDVASDAVLRRLGIGENNLLPVTPGSAAFAEAFLRHQRARRLYVAAADHIDFMGETLFKTTVTFPDDIPPGMYTAEIYLIAGGAVAGMQSTPITVVKSGIDAFLFGIAHEEPVLYGLAAVMMALGIGWIAGRIFEQ